MLPEARNDGLHMADNIVALIDFHRLHADGGANRMAGIGETMAENADLLALIDHRLEHVIGHKHGREREIGRGNGLCERHRVRNHVHRR